MCMVTVHSLCEFEIFIHLFSLFFMVRFKRDNDRRVVALRRAIWRKENRVLGPKLDIVPLRFFFFMYDTSSFSLFFLDKRLTQENWINWFLFSEAMSMKKAAWTDPVWLIIWWQYFWSIFSFHLHCIWLHYIWHFFSSFFSVWFFQYDRVKKLYNLI